MHLAKIMSKSIYILQIYLLSDNIDLDQEEYLKINPMAIFAFLFYTKVFVQSRTACFALIDDLKFIGAMTWYRGESKEIADALVAHSHPSSIPWTSRKIFSFCFFEIFSIYF